MGNQTDKQFDAQLIDEYTRLKIIKKLAEKEGASETLKEIEAQMKVIKLKLQPTELPD